MKPSITKTPGRGKAALIRHGLLLLVLAAGGASEGAGQSVRPGLGSMPYDGGVTFRVWAPNASSVSVRGDFSGWSEIPLASESDGNWSIDVSRARPGAEYQYLLNGASSRRDPRARRAVNSAGNSIIYDPGAFDWSDSSFTTPARKEAVIYQMHVGTFSGAPLPGTFDRAIARLDHLRNLGVNAVKLMPINEFAGSFSWGYNPADPFAIESSYGGPDAFKRFVRACHERGLAVLVDVVHNHYGPTDVDLWQFDGWSQNDLGGIYFYNDNRAHTPWGSTRPDFGRPEVRQFIRDQIFMFLEEYRVDGFRWDSIHNIVNTDEGHNPSGESLVRDINWEMEQTHPDKLRIAEDHAFDFFLNFHSQWDVGYRWALHGQATSPSDGDRDMFALRDLLQNWAGHHRVVFTEAHDYIAAAHDRSRLPGEIDPGNPESIYARKRALLAAGIVMTTPGIPMIFQGQEMHETLPFHDDTALRWDRTESFGGIVEAYKNLISARRDLDGGTQGLMGAGIDVHHIDNDNKVIAFTRWDAGGQTDDVIVIANFSAQTWTEGNYAIPFPSGGTWYSRFNSDARAYQDDFGNIGSAELTVSGARAIGQVNMGMYSIQIFSKTPPPANDPWEMDSNGDGILDGWYLQYGFDPEGPSIADLDTDGDRFPNREEFLLGTDPTDPLSRFSIVSFDFDASGFPRLTWTSAGGRTYRVEYSNDLTAGFNPAAVVTEDGVPEGVETTRTFVDDYSQTGGPPEAGFRSYRITLQPE